MESSSSMLSPNSDPRLVVATHDASGNAVFSSDTAIPLFRPFGPGVSSFANFDTRAAVPVNNLDAVQADQNTIPQFPPNGVNFCITNIPSNFTVPMHRTLSLDYAAVMTSEIVLKLDSGDEKTIKAGEFVVQGGVNHQWINRTEETCRIVFVSVGAEKVRLADGSELGAIKPKRP